MANVLMVACNYGQARHYMAEMSLHRQNVRVILGYNDILGYKDRSIVYVGEYWRLKDIAEIKDYAAAHGMKELES